MRSIFARGVCKVELSQQLFFFGNYARNSYQCITLCFSRCWGSAHTLHCSVVGRNAAGKSPRRFDEVFHPRLLSPNFLFFAKRLRIVWDTQKRRICGLEAPALSRFWAQHPFEVKQTATTINSVSALMPPKSQLRLENWYKCTWAIFCVPRFMLLHSWFWNEMKLRPQAM